MLVQAKRLEDTEQIYKGINRSIGKRTPPVRQIDQLLATARSQGVAAIYAFYNHVTDVSRVPQRCGSLKSTDSDQVHGFGISLADASKVHGSLPDETFDEHRQHSMPLHCLLCNGGSASRPSGGTPALAASGLARLGIATSPEGLDPDGPGLRSGLHPTVERALELARRRAEGGDIPARDDMPDIAGVVVLRDTKDEIKSNSERG